MKNKEINWTCDCAPLQAEGIIKDKFWYFRARHNYWSLSIGSSHKKAIEQELFYIGSEYKPKIEGAASWMDKKTGAKLIRFGLKCYEKVEK